MTPTKLRSLAARVCAEEPTDEIAAAVNAAMECEP